MELSSHKLKKILYFSPLPKEITRKKFIIFFLKNVFLKSLDYCWSSRKIKILSTLGCFLIKSDIEKFLCFRMTAN